MNNEFKYYVGQEWLMWEDDIETWVKHMIVISRYLELTERIEIVMIDCHTGTPVTEPIRLVAPNQDGNTFIPRKYFEEIAGIENGFEWKPANRYEQLEYYKVAELGDCFKSEGRDEIYLLSSAGITSEGHSKVVLINIRTGGRLGPIVEVQNVKNITENEFQELDYCHKLHKTKRGTNL